MDISFKTENDLSDNSKSAFLIVKSDRNCDIAIYELGVGDFLCAL